MLVVAAGVAYTDAADGDQRADLAARSRTAERLGVSPEWAVVHQVHGDRVVTVDRPGGHGDADALVTTTPGLPLAVFTADCLGVVLIGSGALGVAHVGWRGLVAGVLERTLETLEAAGATPDRAVMGPGIRSCCFEVGPEVARLFPAHVARTTWGTESVDLYAAAADRLPVPSTTVGSCTRCGGEGFSHRRDATTHRMAAIGWLPG